MFTGSRLLLPTLVFAAAITPCQADLRAFLEPYADIDVRRDARAAAGNDKALLLVFVQDGCAPCIKLEEQTLTDPAVRAYFSHHYTAYGINLYGSLAVTDASGRALDEKRYAQSQAVRGTPTFIFHDAAGKEIYRAAGYFNAHDFVLLGRYVREAHHLAQPSFHTWRAAIGLNTPINF